MMGAPVHNPFRREVLAWYHKIGKSAFTIPWATDEDAMFVLSEARRLFRQNQLITDEHVIRKKIAEAEMRYEIGVHYRIPYLRPPHKTQGSTQESGIAYHPAYDSLLDSAPSPRLGDIREDQVSTTYMGGIDSQVRLYDEVRGVDDTDDGRSYQR